MTFNFTYRTGAALLALGLVGEGCSSTRTNHVLPFVQPSADAPADRTITVTASGNFSPPCLVINLGQTVEWNNPTGRTINVTSATPPGGSPELYSPSLVASAARWRHTFTKPGRVDYQDSSGGSTVVSPYYATGGAPSASGAAAFGAVCVRAADGSGCTQLCCMRGGPPDQCAPGATCDIPVDREISYGFCETGATPLDLSVTD